VRRNEKQAGGAATDPPWVDEAHPANAQVLNSLSKKGKEPVITAHDSVEDPYYSCGSHPDVVERVWDELNKALPADCRCILYGTPALVHPVTGVVLVLCYGTQYCLRLPEGVLEEALRAGCKTSTRWTTGGETNIQEELGPDWIFGAWAKQEPDWCRTVYDRYS
jgi:hypothetical protein